MSLQDDVNERVGAIKTKLASASAAADQFDPTAVDLSETIEAIEDEVEVDNGPVATALLAICDAIDANGGDTVAARAAIASIGNGAINFAPLKTALTQVGEVMSAVSENLGHAATSARDHIEGGVGIVSLLIDQSNFDGASQ
ncbi:MAG: hypothetical protein WBV94_33590 [Blastocatellia bacterium]